MRLHQKSPDLIMNVPLQSGQSLLLETKDGVIEYRKTWLLHEFLRKSFMVSDALWSRDFPPMVMWHLRKTREPENPYNNFMYRKNTIHLQLPRCW